jgi:hypothetical protein
MVLGLFTALPLAAEESQTLQGEFHWERRDVRGALEAVFTPTGEGTWDVSFHFEFREEPHTYTGTAEGSLENGPLKGTVKNENKKRTFTFEGTVTDGQFTGDHSELDGEKVYDTGTLTLGS